jgi:hypothetical protein
LTQIPLKGGGNGLALYFSVCQSVVSASVVILPSSIGFNSAAIQQALTTYYSGNPVNNCVRINVGEPFSGANIGTAAGSFTRPSQVMSMTAQAEGLLSNLTLGNFSSGWSFNGPQGL